MGRWLQKPGVRLQIGFGLFFLLLALSEILLGSEGLIVRNRQVLQFALVQNGLEWVTGILLLVTALIGRGQARVLLLLAGVFYLALTVAGAIARHRVGSGLGFTGPLPISYEVIHLISALVLLSCAAASRDGATIEAPG